MTIRPPATRMRPWRGSAAGPRRRSSMAAAAAPTPSSTAETARQVPGAERSVSNPNPPASEPVMAPTVLHVYASPTSRPTPALPRPRREMSIGNW
ncbi:MAG: hypothetical protein WKG00_40270 [Polyangiaceae bacterium]